MRKIIALLAFWAVVVFVGSLLYFKSGSRKMHTSEQIVEASTRSLSLAKVEEKKACQARSYKADVPGEGFIDTFRHEYADLGEKENFVNGLKLANINSAFGPDFKLSLGEILTLPCLEDLQKVEFPDLHRSDVLEAAIARAKAEEATEYAPQDTDLEIERKENTVEDIPNIPPVADAIETASPEGKKEVAMIREVKQEPAPVYQSPLKPETQPAAESEVFAPSSTVAKRQKENIVMKGLVRTKKVGLWPFRNPRKMLAYTSMALGLFPNPALRGVAIGTSFAIMATAPRAYAQVAPPVAGNDHTPTITREELERVGKTPYLRYMVPPGDIDWVSISVFQQPQYSKDTQKDIESKPRELAMNLGLTGALAYNEVPEQGGARVALSGKAVIIYDITERGLVPLYLADCTYKGKPYANRLKLISQAAPAVVSQQVPQINVQTPAPQVNVNTPPQTVNNNFPGVPNPMTINLVGLPQYPTPPAMPSNVTVTYRVINETKTDWSTKTKNVGFGVMGAGIGVGAASLGIQLPGALENMAHEKRVGAENVAKTNADATIQASQNYIQALKTRNPDTTVINNTGVNNPNTTIDPNLTNTSANTVNPTINPNIAPNISPTISAQGGNAQGGNAQGGQAAPAAPVTVTNNNAPVVTANGGNANPVQNQTGGTQNQTGGTVNAPTSATPPVTINNNPVVTATSTGGTSTSTSNSDSTSNSNSTSSSNQTQTQTQTQNQTQPPPSGGGGDNHGGPPDNRPPDNRPPDNRPPDNRPPDNGDHGNGH